MSNSLKEDFNLVWLTDIHLDRVSDKKVEKLCNEILNHDPDAIIITGDISESTTIEKHLLLLDKYVKNKAPIFFVLGNHDYYDGSIIETRQMIAEKFTYDEASKMILEPRLGWLGSSGVVPLTEKTCLVGHDGWYDGQYANWFRSRIIIEDYFVIRELAKQAPLREMQFNEINRLAREATNYVEKQIIQAVNDYENIIVATHVPPFRENSTYKNKLANDDWMPHFSSKTMGDMLRRVASEHKDKCMTVLCGHSHSYVKRKISSNLTCITGKAVYKFPKINKVFKVK